MLTIASLFADQLALGMPGTGFGWKQVLGTLLGLVITAAGGALLYRIAQAEASEKGEDDSA